MKFGIPNRRTFNTVFWLLQLFIIGISAHLILWHGEPEGFFEIFGVDGYLCQYVIHVVAFFVLAWLLDCIHRREFVKGGNAWLVPRKYVRYTLKTLVLPLFMAILFAYAYFKNFGNTLDIKEYLQRVFPLFLLFVILFNLIILVRYILLRIAWVTTQADKQAQELNDTKGDALHPAQSEVADREIEFSRDWVKYSVPLKRVAYCCLEQRSAMIYLDNGQKGRYGKSLTKIKDFIGDDPRFFSTRSWIVNRAYIQELEGSFSRKKFIVLKFPFAHKLSLSKDKISEFKQWCDGVNETAERS